MRKTLWLAVAFTALGSRALALAVIDSSNLAQNVVAAREAVAQTANQLQMIQNQLQQYQRMLRDARNPAQWVWGDMRASLGRIGGALDSVRGLSLRFGGFEGLLGEFGSYDDYDSGHGYGGPPSSESAGLQAGAHAGSLLRKETAGSLLRLVEEERRGLDDYAGRLERLQAQSVAAGGQQEALQATNEFLSLQIELLSRIQALLLAQNNLLAAEAQARNDREARERMGTALQMGEGDLLRSERSGSGRGYSTTDF